MWKCSCCSLLYWKTAFVPLHNFCSFYSCELISGFLPFTSSFVLIYVLLVSHCLIPVILYYAVKLSKASALANFRCQIDRPGKKDSCRIPSGWLVGMSVGALLIDVRGHRTLWTVPSRGGGLGLYKTAGWPPAREMSGELPSSMVSVSFPASSFPLQWIVTWQCKPTLSLLLLVVVLICATERQASTASSLASCFSVYCISHPESFASLGKL